MKESRHSLLIHNKISQFHKLIQSWNKQVELGSVIVQTISKTNLRKNTASVNTKLFNLCEQMRLIIYQMENTVSEMNIITNNLKAMTKLCSETELFNTWTIKQIEECCAKIHETYKQELALKTRVAEDVAHQKNDLQGTILEAVWKYEPEIPLNSNVILQSILLEVGLHNKDKTLC